MDKINELANSLLTSIDKKDAKKTSAYDTQAEIRNIKGDTAWVHIPGGVDETPVALTINANVGDQVMVRVSGGKAWIVGNATNPPTDDTRANSAFTLATDASELSAIASRAATEAQLSAIEADGHARAAEEEAGIARGAASKAVQDLSIVEDVVGTVDWIAKHGVYRFCTETSVIEGKVYYTLTGVAITNPTGNPSRNGYYELVDNKYIPSEDIEVDPEKTYYQITAMMVKEPSGDPSTIPYYELEISEAVYQYINTHLALTDSGLRVTDGSASSVLISSNGVTIYSNGDPVAQYGKDAIIGDPSGYHIKIVGGEEPRLSFMNRSGDLATEIAYLSNDELYIPRVVVVDSMKIGNWIWDAISNQNHLTLKWEG